MMRLSVLDDLDGTEGAAPVQFGLDGETFEIDLSKANHAKLREIAGFYIGHGRKITPAARERHTSVYAHFGSTARPGALRVKASRA
jgi:hypothetical protein